MSTTPAFTMERFIDVYGRRVRVRSSGTGPPVLLINGLGANLATWTPLVRELEGFQVISFDAPGAGRSESPRTPYTIARVANVARKVLDEFGHEQADILGYSLGGAVAQRLALQHPDRVRRLALVSTSCGIGGVPGALRALLAVSSPMRLYGQTGYDLAMKMVELAPAEKQSQFLLQHSAWHQEAVPSAFGYTLQMAAFSSFNSLPWLHHIQQPTLVLSGSHDRLMPMANSAIMAAYLPHARLKVIEGWGHYLLHDSTSGAGAAVADFFSAENHASSAAWESAVTVTREDMARFVQSAPRSAHPGFITGGWVRRFYPLRIRRD